MAASPTASSSSAPTAAAATAAEATDGPVLSVVSKRIRALRKKYNRIAQMEDSLASGKKLNPEQEEVLRSKPVLAALIEELERLRAPLVSALAEEVSSRPAPTPAPAPAAAASSSDSDSSVQDFLPLVYFGSLFDVKQQGDFVATMVARTHERNCCITYDYVTDDAADLLAESDLDAVSALASLAASRPASAAGVSHREALQACAHHARLWLRRANEPIHPDSTVTYAAVREKLEKIMSLDYYTAQPDIRAAEAVAAAVGNYGAGGVQAQESMVVSPQAPEAGEESLAVEVHKDEREDSQATEIYTDHQAPAVDAEHVEDALLNPTDEVPPAEVEQERFDADVEDQEQKDQQFVQRRSYPNQRGGGRGGRRGYSNGRGGRGGRGGGYQNGRGGGGGAYQNGRGGGGGFYHGYQNEPGYYQPRNYNNNRGRGGRSGGGNSYYNNHGGGAQGGGQGRVELGANA